MSEENQQQVNFNELQVLSIEGVSVNEVNVILAGLSELPHKVSRGLIDKITRQINEKAPLKLAELQAQAQALSQQAANTADIAEEDGC